MAVTRFAADALRRLRRTRCSTAPACAPTSRATSPTSSSPATCSATRRTGSRCSRRYLGEIEKGDDGEDRRAGRSSTRARPRRPGTAAACRGPGSRCARSTRRPRWPRRTAPAPSSSAARITSRALPPTCCAPPSAGSSRSCRARDPLRRRGRAARRHRRRSSRPTRSPPGLPTSGDPILVDVSTSITSMGFAKQRDATRAAAAGAVADRRRGQRDRRSRRALCSEPKGALLPLGGLDAGYKGFGLALLIEALTAGLAGFGRADPPEGWGGTVFVQVLDPEAFGGLAAFRRQMDHLARRRARIEAAAGRRSRPAARRRRPAAAARAAGERRRALSDDHAGARAVGGRSSGVAPPSRFVDARVIGRRDATNSAFAMLPRGPRVQFGDIRTR